MLRSLLVIGFRTLERVRSFLCWFSFFFFFVPCIMASGIGRNMCDFDLFFCVSMKQKITRPPEDKKETA